MFLLYDGGSMADWSAHWNRNTAGSSPTLTTTWNRPFAAKPSRDLLFIKLWAATLRMPEMEKACRKHQNENEIL